LPLFISRAGYGSVMTGAGCTAVMFHPTKAHLLSTGRTPQRLASTIG